MRTKLKITEGIFPMPVLMVATYNEDGSVNVMNAAWGTMQGADKHVFQFGVAALCEQGQPYLLRFAAGSIVKNRQVSDGTCRFLHILSSPFSAF